MVMILESAFLSVVRHGGVDTLYPPYQDWRRMIHGKLASADPVLWRKTPGAAQEWDIVSFGSMQVLKHQMHKEINGARWIEKTTTTSDLQWIAMSTPYSHDPE